MSESVLTAVIADLGRGLAGAEEERDEWKRRALKAEEVLRKTRGLLDDVLQTEQEQLMKREAETIARVVAWLQGLTVALNEEANSGPTGVGEEDEAWESAIHTQCVYRDISARLERGEWKEKEG